MASKEDKPEDINELIQKISVATAAQNASEETQPSSNIELTNKVVDTLFDMIKRKMLGILSHRQVTGIKKLYLVNKIIFDGRKSILTDIIDNEIDLSVSVSGKGREQLVKLTQVEDPLEKAGRFSEFIKR